MLLKCCGTTWTSSRARITETACTYLAMPAPSWRLSKEYWDFGSGTANAIGLSPRLPEEWKSVTLNLTVLERDLTVEVRPDDLLLRCRSGRPLRVEAFDDCRQLSSKSPITFRRSRPAE